jgi:hypothetical protein
VTVGSEATEKRFRQAVSPVSLSFPLLTGSLNIRSAYLYIEERDSTGTLDASGPLDTQLSGEWTFGQLVFTGYANLPTGTDSLDAAESGLAQGMSRNDVNFPIKTFGQGLDFGGAITFGHPVNNWAFSGGGGYIVRGD